MWVEMADAGALGHAKEEKKNHARVASAGSLSSTDLAVVRRGTECVWGVTPLLGWTLQGIHHSTLAKSTFILDHFSATWDRTMSRIRSDKAQDCRSRDKIWSDVIAQREERMEVAGEKRWWW